MTHSKIEKLFNITFLVLMMALVIGTPMFYTSITRSVFEVNKLILLRFILVFGVFIWFFKYCLFKDNGYDNKEEESYSILGFRWKRIGLEIPLLIWLIVNFISTILSQNIRVSIIGSYDRWEGIITAINYLTLIMMFAKLVVKEFQVRWICFGIIISTAIAAIYGVLQSAGFDFMHWSKDPTFRVFASINNPVHYCAYVAMTVPLGISLLLYKGRRYEGKERSLKEPIFYKAIQFFLFFLMGIVIILNSYFSVGSFEVTPTFFILIFSWVLTLFINTPKIKKPFLFIIFLVLLNGFVFNSQLSIPFIQVSILLGTMWYLCAILNSDSLAEVRKLVYLTGFTAGLLILIQIDFIQLTRLQWVGLFFAGSIQTILFMAPKWENSIKALLFICTGLIYYTQVLSFSRATWVGFLLMMPLYYLFVTHSFTTRSEKTFIKDFFLTLLMNGLFCLLFIFRIYSHHILLSVGSILLFLLAIGLLIRNTLSEGERLRPKELIYLGLFLMSIYPVFILVSTSAFIMSFKCLLLVGMYWLGFQFSNAILRVHQKIVLMLLFAHLQLTGVSLFNFLLFFVFVALYYFRDLRQTSLNSTEKKWLLYFLLLFGFLISLPLIPSLLDELSNLFILTPSVQFVSGLVSLALLFITIYFVSYNKLDKFSEPPNQVKFIFGLIFVAVFGTCLSYSSQLLFKKEITSSNELMVAKNIKARSDGYKQAIKEARIAMWKSAPPWFKDYPIFGSGLDTIKYMYPVYRIPEYGIREGGHNFTPDRLHNEYLNTLCSKGIIGFVSYYILFLLTWYFALLRGLFRKVNSKLSLIIIACLTSSGIFLGQLMFNFGVVATMVLFYIFIGLGYGLVRHNTYD